MIVTVLLCILSTLSFCVCARCLVLVTLESGRGARLSLPGAKFSSRARRLARGYLTVALSILALVSLIGAFSSYFELFANLG